MNWLILIAVASASDVILTPFTPRTTSDLGAAERLTIASTESFANPDYAVISPAEVQRRGGTETLNCAEEPRCLEALWRRFPTARLAIVGQVGWVNGEMDTVVRIYNPGDGAPIEVLSEKLGDEQVVTFASELAQIAGEILPLVPPREPATIAPVAPVVPAPVASATTPAAEGGAVLPTDDPPGDVEPEPVASSEPTPVTTAQSNAAKPVEQESSADTEAFQWEGGVMGFGDEAQGHFEASGLGFDDWVHRHMIRAKSVGIELFAGAVFGDVDRRYDTRVLVVQTEELTFEEEDFYQYDAFSTGQGQVFGLGICYRSLWWFEAGIYGGLQMGNKYLTTGWEQQVEGVISDSYEKEYQPSISWMFLAEPRLRLFLVGRGPVKPFLLAALNFRLYDGYTVPDVANVDYRDRTGGLSFGPTFGGGLTFDTRSIFYFTSEAAWSGVVLPGVLQRGGEHLAYIPKPIEGTGQMVWFRAGIGIHY